MSEQFDPAGPAAAEPASLPPELCFEAKPYESDGGCPAGGVLLLVLVVLGAAVGLGWLTSFVGQWFYLLVLMPLGLGAVLGFVGWGAVHLGKVRNAAVACLVGLAAGLVVMLVVHGCNYERYRETAATRLHRPLKRAFVLDLPQAEARELLDKLARQPWAKKIAQQLKNSRRRRSEDELAQETNLVQERLSDSLDDMRSYVNAEIRAKKAKFTDLLEPKSHVSKEVDQKLEAALTSWAHDLDFWDYLNLMAERGTTVHIKTANIPIGGTFLWLVWAVELLCAGLLAAGMMAWFSSSQPFCTHCQQWKEEKRRGRLLLPVEVVTGHLTRGELGQVAALQPTANSEKLDLRVVACPRCGGEGPVEVRLLKITQSKDGDEEKELCHLTYPGQALGALESLCPLPDKAAPK